MKEPQKQEVFCQFSNIQIALKVGSSIKLTNNATGKSGLYEVTAMSFNESDNSWSYEFTHRQKSHVFENDVMTLKRSQCLTYHALSVTKNALMNNEQPAVKPMSDVPTDDEDEIDNEYENEN